MKRSYLLVLNFLVLCGCGEPKVLLVPSVDAGTHNSFALGERAAIKQLAVIINQNPKKQVYPAFSNRIYKVRWNVYWPGNKKKNLPARGGLGQLIYRRQGKMLDYEVDPESGPIKTYKNIDDAAIHSVANKSGVLKDFEKIDVSIKN